MSCHPSKITILLLIMLMSASLGSVSSFAQQEAPETTPETTPQAEPVQEDVPANRDSEERTARAPQMKEMYERIELSNPGVNPEQISSLFFTNFEQNLIEEARKGLVARPPTQSEIEESEKQQTEGTPVPKGPREISIGGIVYVSDKEWTIWLNGQKITPDRIPPEILDIRVSKESVKLKWFDAFTNQVFPVKLRTHQRFNIDTRIFLPG